MKGDYLNTAVYGNSIVYILRLKKLGFINYVYIVADRSSGKCVLVDPVWDSEKIDGVLENTGFIPEGVLLTHSHRDHVHLADYYAGKHNINVYLSRCEARYSGYFCTGLKLLEDGDEIRVGDMNITAYLTPGHTPGSLCFYLPGFFFTGDTIFSEGCGICPGEEAASQMYDSLQRVMKIIPESAQVYPGHSYGIIPGKTLSTLMRDNLYLNISDRETFVDIRMRKVKRIMSFK